MSENEIHRETHKLDEKTLIALINGKSLHIFAPSKCFIEILPPNYGITIPYKEWSYIKSILITNPNISYSEMVKLIANIEERK